MEVTEMLVMHSILIKVFLGFLVGGLFIPFLTAKTPLVFKKASFIYTMIFQGLITMIAFSAIVAIFTGNLGWTNTTIIMLVIWAILMYIEIKKHKLIKKANLTSFETHRRLKSSFFKISIIQIMLVVLMVVMMILKAKGMITL